MPRRLTAIIGFTIGLIVACVVLILIYFGVSGILIVGQTDFMYIVWPSALMLLVRWRTSVLGVMTTLLAVSINCLLYMLLALILRALIVWFLGAVMSRRRNK